jgi:Response regulator containing CheY-like receiver domain and AraC-type DNA-binding domain
MKILIADDEELLRFSLKSMLEEMKLPLEIIAEAGNGEDAVEMVRLHKPDIAFVDIRMPKMDGLEAIKLAKSLSPNTQWVILTGFAEFDYAKEAVSLGVSYYLLKPMSTEDLEEILSKLLDKSHQNIIVSNMEFQNDVTALFNGIVQVQDLYKKYASILADYKCMIFCYDGCPDDEVKAGLKSRFFNSLREKWSKYLSNDIRFALTALTEREMLLVMARSKAFGNDVRLETGNYFDFVPDTIIQFNSSGLYITAVESEDCISMEALYRQILRIKNVLKYRTLAGIGIKMTINDLCRFENMELYNRLSDSLVKLALSLEDSASLSFTNQLVILERIFYGTEFKLLDTSIKAAVLKYLNNVFGCDLKWDCNFSSFLMELRDIGHRLIDEKHKIKIPSIDVVKEVTDFINKNYMLNIGINQIAAQMGLTPNYLSSLFHKKMGMTYINYVTNIRMLKAKEFLSNPNISIQEIADKIGYFSAPHFSRLFRKQFGMYPSEYRSNLK